MASPRRMGSDGLFYLPRRSGVVLVKIPVRMIVDRGF